MAWTPIADGFDAFSAAVVNEYVGALNERRQALGQATIGVYAEDDLVPNSATIIAAWQQWAEDNLASFVVSHDAGVERAAGHYDNAATIDTYPNLAAVFSAAGIIGYTDWRRFRDDAFFAYGQAAEDDDYAIEILEDLQKILNVLKWTHGNGSGWTSLGESNWKAVTASGPTEATAKAAAAAAYAVQAPAPTNTSPMATSDTSEGWNAGLERVYAYAQYNTGAPPCAREIDFYYRADRWVLNEFDPNGDFNPGYIERRANYFSMIGPTTDTNIVSGRFGSLSQPAWSPNAGPVTRGYFRVLGPAVNTEVVVRWTAFVYQ